MHNNDFFGTGKNNAIIEKMYPGYDACACIVVEQDAGLEPTVLTPSY